MHLEYYQVFFKHPVNKRVGHFYIWDMNKSDKMIVKKICYSADDWKLDKSKILLWHKGFHSYSLFLEDSSRQMGFV